MNKRSITIMAALLVVALIAGISPAQAHERRSAPQNRPAAQSSMKTLDARSHYTEPPGNYDGAQCSGLVTVAPKCDFRYVGYATFTGTMWGDEYYELDGLDPTALLDGKINYEGTAYINGGVKGCGTGTFILDIPEGGYIDMTKYDPLTDSAPGYNTWRLRPGSGTGELTNLVSGSGVNNWTFYPSGSAGITPLAGEGDFTGTITCRR